MLLKRESLPASSADRVEGNEKLQENLVKLTEQLNHANRELAKQNTERQRLENSTRQAQHKYQSLFDNAIEGLYQATLDGRYQVCNPALARFYGYESPAKLLTYLTDIRGQLYVDPNRYTELIELLHSRDTISEFESQVYRQDGSIIWIAEKVRVVRDKNGNFLYYEGFVNDITKRKLAEKSLQKSEAKFVIQTQQLEQALSQLHQTQAQLLEMEKMSSLGQLLACVAHDVNDPVSFVCNNIIPARQYTNDLLTLLALYLKYYPQPVPEIQKAAEEIDLDFLVEDFPKTLSSMQSGAQRIHHIVQSLRNFSRLDQAEMEPLDLHQGIDSTLLIINNRLQANGEKPGIRVFKEYGDLPLVECYGCLLLQVFMNLLCNAIDALEELRVATFKAEGSQLQLAKEPSATPSIRIITEVISDNTDDGEDSASQVVVRIIDNGPGMSEEVRARIFDPFFTTKPVGKGTGLGLAISHDIIIEKHRGQLKCISRGERGTEFRIELPLRARKSYG
ncbi:ATP-binding protein [Lyngbya aestuarii]|uniref:ATP-binding protein n=1 Tax=Lyngbya aestuarii TaxID=118322 RepID=UPI00403DD987